MSDTEMTTMSVKFLLSFNCNVFVLKTVTKIN